MQKKIHIKKGDNVLVLSGEYKGTEAKVLEIVTKTNKAIVEGVNLVSKHTKPDAKKSTRRNCEKRSSHSYF